MRAETIPFPRRWSSSELLAYVQELSKKTSRIRWSAHAEERMIEREIGARQVLDVIRRGGIREGPHRDNAGDWRMNLWKRSAAGQRVEVVLAPCEDERGDTLTVITVM